MIMAITATPVFSTVKVLQRSSPLYKQASTVTVNALLSECVPPRLAANILRTASKNSAHEMVDAADEAQIRYGLQGAYGMRDPLLQEQGAHPCRKAHTAFRR